MTAPAVPLSILHVASCDLPSGDLLSELETTGFRPSLERAAPGDVMDLLEGHVFDIVICDGSDDFSIPLEILSLLRERGADLPLIVLAETVAPGTAIRLMRAGVRDVIGRNDLARLPAIVERELHDAALRREKRAAEIELRESENRFRAMFEQSAVGMSIATVEGRYMRVNRRMTEIVGWPLEEMVGSKFTRFTHPADLESNLRIREMLRSGDLRMWSGEKRYVRRDGSEVWAILTLSPIRDAEGNVEYFFTMVDDISARKESEARAAFQAQLLDVVDQAVIAMTTEGQVIYWNRFAETLYGWTADEAVGRSVLDLMASAAIEGEMDGMMERIRSGTSWSGEMSLRRRDGTRITALVTESPIHRDDGTLTGSVAISTDVSARHEAEQALAESERRYRGIFEGAKDLIVAANRDGMITEINPAFQRFLGWDREEWLGRSFLDLLPEEDHPFGRKAFNNAFRFGETKEILLRVIAADGSIREIELSSAIRYEDGEPTALVGFGRDVTVERRAIAESRKLAEDLDLLLASVPVGFFWIDLKGRCQIVNRAAVELLGIDDPGCQPDLMQFFSRTDGSPIDPKRLARDKGDQAIDGTARSVSGESFPVRITVSRVMRDGAEVGYAVTFSDVTDRKLIEAKLEQANRVSSLGRLAAVIAHEFNNVLMGIQPFVEILRRRAGDDAGLQKIASQISQSVQRGGRITQEILRFTQPSAPEKRPIDAGSFVGALREEVGTSLGGSHAFSVTVGDDLPAFEVDAEQMHQVLINLIHNARDASPSGSTIDLVIARATREGIGEMRDAPEGDEFVHIIVRDEGEGIPPAMREKIFEPLFTTKRKGTGLGLAVAYQIIRQHGGRLWVESRPGRTEFHLLLPLKSGAAGQSAVASGARRVLLVEDDDATSDGLVEILRLESFDVDTARTGSDAIERLSRQRPDAIVLDVALPDIDGIELYGKIAELAPELPVVFSTGAEDRSRLDPWLARHNVGFLLKPYEGASLVEMLNRLTG